MKNYEEILAMLIDEDEIDNIINQKPSTIEKLTKGMHDLRKLASSLGDKNLESRVMKLEDAILKIKTKENANKIHVAFSSLLESIKEYKA